MQLSAIHNFLGLGTVLFKNNELARAAIFEFAEKAGLHDLCVVQNQNIAWVQKFVEISVERVGHFASFAI